MNKKTIKDIKDLHKKRILLTADFNISLKDGQIANDSRILEILPTIKYLYKRKCKIIIVSHLGRPKGHDAKLSLKPVAKRLEKLSKIKVNLIDHFWEDKAIDTISKISNDQLVLLENIRFYKGEEKNDLDFAKHLSLMADYFVNDAFGASHRIHASIVGITQFIEGVAGLLMARESDILTRALEHPERPLLVIIGGAKTPEKISVIDKILDVADTVALGGAIANTFLAAWGFGMGTSLVDYEMIESARLVFWNASRKHSALILPQDVVIYDKKSNGKPKIVDYDQVPSHVAIYDIGPKTNKHYRQLVNKAKTIIWNGPMGLFELKNFSTGTNELLKSIATSSAFSIIGGGDTLTSLKNKKYLKKVSHLSTGGSAMLQFLKSRKLPGIDVLQDK